MLREFFAKHVINWATKSKWGLPILDLIATGQEKGAGWSYNKAVNDGYLGTDIVYSAVDMIASAVASVPIRAYFRTAENKEELAPDNHPLNRLLERPNILQRGDLYKYSVVAFRLLGGNAYTWVNVGATDPRDTEAEPLELWAMSPISAYLRIEGGSIWYQVNKNSFANCGAVQVPVSRFDVDSMTGRSNLMDWSTFNPKTLCRGVSPLEAADVNLDIYRYGNFWNRAYFKQGCRPSTALVSQEPIGEKSYDRMKKELNEVYSGLENGNGRPIILDNGVKPAELSKNPKDADFSNSHDQQQKDLARAFRIPPVLLNLGSDTTYENQKEAKIALWDDVIIPLANDLCAELKENLVPRYRDEKLTLKADFSKISALEPRRKDMWERADKSNELTIDEKRALKGYPPLPNNEGQVLLVNASQVPVGLLTYTPPSE